MKKFIAGLLLCSSMSANALNIDYEEPKFTAEPYKAESFKYVGENDLIKIFINPKQVYKVRANFFEKIRVVPIRLDLKLDQDELNKAGNSYINFTLVDCISKKNLIAFVHVYDKNNKLLRVEENTAPEWEVTEEYSNTRMLTEYVCNL